MIPDITVVLIVIVTTAHDTTDITRFLMLWFCHYRTLWCHYYTWYHWHHKFSYHDHDVNMTSHTTKHTRYSLRPASASSVNSMSTKQSLESKVLVTRFIFHKRQKRGTANLTDKKSRQTLRRPFFRQRTGGLFTCQRVSPIPSQPVAGRGVPSLMQQVTWRACCSPSVSRCW